LITRNGIAHDGEDAMPDSSITRRAALGGASAGIAALGASEAMAQTDTRKTFVLVHGAWHGGWCWGKVAERLRAAGHRVFTPTLTGLGDRAHLIAPNVGLATFIEDVVATIDMEDLSDIVLVGHSFGSPVIAGVADARTDRIRRLVFLDSFLVQSGQSPFDQLPTEMVEARRAAAIKAPGLFGETLAMPPPAPNVFGVTDPKDAAWIASRLKPHPLKSYEDKLELKRPLGAGLPKTYIACTDPDYRANSAARKWVRTQPDWTYSELATGHDAMILAPDALTEMLLRAA
jgi:pimeloyl-ACP methyl ester carboxylesterase